MQRAVVQFCARFSRQCWLSLDAAQLVAWASAGRKAMKPATAEESRIGARCVGVMVLRLLSTPSESDSCSQIPAPAAAT